MSMSTGQRPPENQRWVPQGVRRDITWDERVQRHRESLVPRHYPSWQPSRLPEPPVIQIRVAAEPAFDPVRPGLIRLYAERMAHADSTRQPVRETHQGERLLVGELVDEGGQVRALALVGVTRPVGRSGPEHYRLLYPSQRLRFRRLRLGRMPAGSVVGLATPWSAARASATPGNWWRVLFTGSAHHPRLGGSIRLLFATCAALLLLLGAASTSFAAQSPSVGQSGSSIESAHTQGQEVTG
jgi:hypothetical protein